MPATPHTRAPQVAALFNEYQRQAVLYPGGSTRELGCHIDRLGIYNSLCVRFLIEGQYGKAVLYPGGSAREWGCPIDQDHDHDRLFSIACFKGCL